MDSRGKKKQTNLQEDNTLLEIMSKITERKFKWKEIAQELNNSTNNSNKKIKSPRAVRERWLFNLSFSKNKDKWTEEEEKILFLNQMRLGKKWTLIAKKFSNR